MTNKNLNGQIEYSVETSKSFDDITDILYPPHPCKFTLSPVDQLILKTVIEYPEISSNEIALRIHVDPSTIRRRRSVLFKMGILFNVCSNRSPLWVVNWRQELSEIYPCIA